TRQRIRTACAGGAGEGVEEAQEQVSGSLSTSRWGRQRDVSLSRECSCLQYSNRAYPTAPCCLAREVIHFILFDLTSPSRRPTKMSFFAFLFRPLRRKAARKHAVRGDAHNERGEFDDALKAYDNSVRLDPGAAYVRRKRAMVYFNKGRYDDAFAEAEQALHLDPAQFLAHHCKAWVNVQRGEYDRAIDDFSAVLRLAPLFAPGYAGRGHAFIAKNNLDNAVADL